MKITISGIEGYDGEYDFDVQDFNQRELADMERVSGVPLAKWEDGYLSVTVSLAAAVLKRAGKPVVEDMLWNSKVGAIKLDPSAGDAGPPELSPRPSADGETSSSASSDTANGSENQDSLPSGTGSRGSANGSASDRVISAT